MKTGVIGLGAMGAGMARNLAKANHLETVYNRTTSKAESTKSSNALNKSNRLINRQSVNRASYFSMIL